jgi:hypothetical protein
MVVYKLNKRCLVCHEPFTLQSGKLMIREENKRYRSFLHQNFLQYKNGGKWKKCHIKQWNKPKAYHRRCYEDLNRGIVGEIHL